jgi:hypothetical protein
LIGAAIWAAIGYFANAEVGYVAWGIGLLVGVGVAALAKGSMDGVTGAIAAACAVGGVVLGKYLVVHFLVADAIPAELIQVDAGIMINRMSWEVAEEHEAKQKPIMVNGKAMTVEEIENVDDLPQAIRDEAKKRWTALSPDEQSEKMDAHQAEMKAMFAGVADEARNEGFMNSFGAFDLLWLFLAVGTAFKIGSGANS